jgi:HEAT repeat protein
MSSPKLFPQAQAYLLEIGPPIAQTIVPRLQEPDPAVREALIDVLGAVGGESTVPVLQAATKDANASVAAAAKRALARIALQRAPQ